MIPLRNANSKVGRMNIQEMQKLCERLLKEGVDPLTPIVVVNKEVIVYDEGEDRQPEIDDEYSLEEVDGAELVMSDYRPDGSPKMAVMMPITGPVLMLTSLESSGKTIQGFVEHLEVPGLENLAAVYGRSNRVYGPKEFVVQPPVFNGLPQKEEVVTRDWLLKKLRRSIPKDLMPSATQERVVCSKPYYERWVTTAATVEGEADSFSHRGSGVYVNIDDFGQVIGPHWVYLQGATHEYLVNLATEATYVMLDGGKSWLPWTNDKDIVADSQPSVCDSIENFI